MKNKSWIYQEILKASLVDGRFEEGFERFVLEMKIEEVHKEGVF